MNDTGKTTMFLRDNFAPRGADPLSGFRAAAAPAPAPRLGLVVFEGVALADALLPHRAAAAAARTGWPSAVRLLGARPTVRTACGLALHSGLRPGADLPALDCLIVPCSLIRSPDFATGASIGSLRAALRRADRLLFLAPDARTARRARILLAAPGALDAGGFAEALGASAAATRLVADGPSFWAVGPDAGGAAADWLASVAA